VQQYQQTNDPAALEKYKVNNIKPQSANSFELVMPLYMESTFRLTWWVILLPGKFHWLQECGQHTGTMTYSFLNRDLYTTYSIAYNVLNGKYLRVCSQRQL